MPYNEFFLKTRANYNIAILCWAPETEGIDPGKSYFVAKGFFNHVNAIGKILYSFNPDIVHVHSMFQAVTFVIASLLFNPKMLRRSILTIHSSFNVFRFQHQLSLLGAAPFFSRVVACGKSSYESIPEWFRKILGGKLGYIQNGVDFDRIKAAKNDADQRGLSHDPALSFICVAALNENKNQKLILNAIASRKMRGENFSLTIVGDGPLGRELKRKTEELSLEDKVIFTGLIPRKRVFELLLHHDIFISASRGEGLPVSLLEALAAGCFPITSSISPHLEVTSQLPMHIESFHPEDSEGLADLMQRCIRIGRKRIKDMREALITTTVTKFSIKATLFEYHKVYMSILKEKGNA